MLRQSVTRLREGLRKGEYSARELVEASLASINQQNPTLNALITVTPESALAAADDADRQLAAGDAPDLCGIPLIHKDNFCTDGVLTTCGARMLANFVPAYDATVTRNAASHGAITVGKANMDEFAMGSSSEHGHFGVVRNPWDHERVPGGSSGGSAAAVAAAMAPLATASDTGGSIRQPAAFCGITGMKPSYGRVSRYGLVAYASSLDQAGVMGVSAEDCAWLLRAISGFDPLDSTCVQRPVEDYPAQLDGTLNGLKIGLPKPYWEGLEPAVADAVHAQADELVKLGAELVEVEMPNASLAVSTYYLIAQAECSSNLSRYDGVRFGHRCEDPKDLQDLYRRSRGEGFCEETQRRILVGTFALSSGYIDAYYGKAMRARRLISDDFTAAFEHCDLMLSPTAPSAAFKIGEKETDPIAMYLADVNTVAVNLAGLPALSTPGPQVSGLPVGGQLIGPYFSEARLLMVAHQLQQATDWHLQVPEAAA
ncbi:MAG: Asp-tRNA(Asn)/Glu-tRNA(Gln) amidotransferase subunit GatA [Pseudomonadota bacterium]